MTTDQSLRDDWILILGALAYQYLGGMPPCHMCHWQRWPHIAAAVIGLIGGGFLPRRYAHFFALAAIVLVLASGLIGAYQTGMQWGFLPGPTSCTGPRYVLGSTIVPEAQCDFIAAVFLGQTLAFWNGVISIGVAAIGFTLLLRNARAA
jgi:disulfide bond formation protein DsbB